MARKVPNTASNLTPATSSRTLLGRRRGRGGTRLDSLDRRLLALALRLGRGRVPVVDHLESENEVEGEAGDEAVQDELIVNLLKGCEDARERAGEIVEDLRRCVRRLS